MKVYSVHGKLLFDKACTTVRFEMNDDGDWCLVLEDLDYNETWLTLWYDKVAYIESEKIRGRADKPRGSRSLKEKDYCEVVLEKSGHIEHVLCMGYDYTTDITPRFISLYDKDNIVKMYCVPRYYKIVDIIKV